MTDTTSTPRFVRARSAPGATPAAVPPRRRTMAAGVLAAVAVLAGVIAMSVNAPMEDPFERDARVLITTFGLGMAVLGAAVALVPFRRGEPWAWCVLWAWPVFFVAHVVTLGTVVPDAVLAVVTAAALLAGRPSRPEAA
jgi:hypothetical protein